MNAHSPLDTKSGASNTNIKSKFLALSKDRNKTNDFLTVEPADEPGIQSRETSVLSSPKNYFEVPEKKA